MVVLKVHASEKLTSMLRNWVGFLEQRTNSKKIEFSQKEDSKEKVFSIKDEKIWIELE